jgi:hypothetical protein
VTTGTAWGARRLGRTPDEGWGTSASTLGSSPLCPAWWTPRARTVGLPRGVGRPSDVGRETRRPGGGLERPARRAGASPWRQAAPPGGSTSSLRPPSPPARPPGARTSRPARPSLAGRKMRSERAWTRRCLLLLAAWERVRWRGREGALCGGWPWRPCLVPAPRAAPGGRRAPSRPPRAAVPGLHRPVTASDGSARLPFDVGAASSRGSHGRSAPDGLRPPGCHRCRSPPAAPPTPAPSSRLRGRRLHPGPGLRLA